MTEGITARAFKEASGTGDWRVISEGACSYFKTGSFAAAVRFVDAIGALPNLDAGHPDIDIRHDGVTVRLITYTTDYYGLSQRDLELARAISSIASDFGFTADPSAVQSMLVVPGGPNVAEIMPFWQAVLGYDRRTDSPEADLVDPRNRGAAFWLEEMKETRPDGGGAVHVGIWVPIEIAQARVAAALAAGGRIVRDKYAPAWWTLADSAGNEADISTIETRD